MRIWVIMCIVLMGSLTGVSAQEVTNLELPNKLYFNTFASGWEKHLFYVQENTTPITVFSTQDSIFDYSWSPDGTKIVMVTNEGGTIGPELYTAEFDLIHPLDVKLYENDTFHFPMAWTPDGDALRFLSPSATGSPQIVTLALDSPDDRTVQAIPLRDSEELAQIYWSPDGRYMLYLTLSPLARAASGGEIYQPKAHYLYLFDLETLQRRQVTAASYQYCVAWSADGSLFASVSDYRRDTGFPWLLRANNLEIYNLDLERMTEIGLTMDLLSSVKCPMAWSNEGQEIAIEFGQTEDKDYPTYQAGLAVIDINTLEIRLVGISSLTYGIVSMAWSPDNSWIAIETLYNAYGDIRLFSVDTGQEIIIPQPDGIPLNNPTWRVSNE